ncbi:beta-propeller domain-containing protein [Nocardioides cynanchi]|uniref:beta-propeller domain-containing protein n=1 Tax=Nocardioides cynanchi TaxID=2558918 RepID=UPI0012484967|nr:beta-propeller domain-containing protein [Nocardioides cynanchi]
MSLPSTVFRRTASVVGVVLGVLAAFVAGFAVASRNADTSTSPVRLAGQDLGTGRSCPDLLRWYVDHAVDRVTAWGWNGPVVYDGGAVPGSAVGLGTAGGDASAGAPLDTATGSATGTNVQEAGVDEPDIAKVSGTVLARVVDDTVTTYDVSGRRPRELGSVPLLGMSGTQLLLDGNRLVAVGATPGSPTAGASYGSPPPSTMVRTFDLSDPSRPTEVGATRYDGSLVTARQAGGVVRLVLSSGLPALPFVTPDGTRSTDEALKANQAVVRESTIDQWLPTMTDGRSAPRVVVPCTNVAVPDTFGGLGTLTVVGLDPSDPTTADATAVATGSTLAYVSPTHLYVATSPEPAPWGCCRELAPQPGSGTSTQTGPDALPQAPDSSTELYAFDLSGTSATYVGAGSVDGQVASSWSMDESGGVLRVAVGSVGGAPTNSVVLLRPTTGRLVEVGRLDGLGVDQQIRSMRWFDGLAVMVTFQQVDPLYVLDLSDPTDPRVRGALHLPGWSSYLHPVGGHLLLGLGQTAPSPTPVDVPPMPTMPPASTSPIPPEGSGSAPDAGTVSGGPVSQPPVRAERAKATLVGIADLAHPRAVGTVRYPAGSIAQAGLDPHQVTWLPDSRTLLTVVSQGYGGPQAWISVLRIQHGTLHGHLVPVTSATGPAGIRTLPLPDGRVLLVTPSAVRFLHP